MHLAARLRPDVLCRTDDAHVGVGACRPACPDLGQRVPADQGRPPRLHRRAHLRPPCPRGPRPRSPSSSSDPARAFPPTGALAPPGHGCPARRTRSPTPSSALASRPSTPTLPARSTPPRLCGPCCLRHGIGRRPPGGRRRGSASPWGSLARVVILAPWTACARPCRVSSPALLASASYGRSYVYMARYLTAANLPPLALSAAQLLAATGLLILATPFGGPTPGPGGLDAGRCPPRPRGRSARAWPTS